MFTTSISSALSRTGTDFPFPSPRQLQATSAALDPGLGTAQRIELGRALSRLDTLERSLRASGTSGVASGGSEGPSVPPSVTGSEVLLRTVAATVPTLSSTSGIAATASPASTDPLRITWSASDTNIRTFVEGAYDGSDGDGTLAFIVESDGTIHESDLPIRVEAPDGSVITTFTVGGSDPLGTRYDLGNGLSLYFEEVSPFYTGDLNAGVRAELTVAGAEGDGVQVNPDNSFDGTGVDSSNINGAETIGNGRFFVNGERLRLNRRDSLSDVLAGINALAAGVTATFDATGQRVVLTENETNAGRGIVLTDDNSGFLEAVRLEAATVESTTVEDENSPLAAHTAFDGVGTGSIVINGTSIAIDVDTYSLGDVVDAINAADAGASATLTSTQDDYYRVGLSGTGEQMTLDDGGTGLFAALGIDSTTYEATSSSGGSSDPVTETGTRLLSYRVADDLEDVQEVFERLFGTASGEGLSALEEVLAGIFDELSKRYGERTLEGLGLRLVGADEGFLSTSRADRRRLTAALQQDDPTLLEILVNGWSGSGEGLIEDLRQAIEDQLRGAGGGTVGTIVDVTV